MTWSPACSIRVLKKLLMTQQTGWQTATHSQIISITFWHLESKVYHGEAQRVYLISSFIPHYQHWTPPTPSRNRWMELSLKVSREKCLQMHLCTLSFCVTDYSNCSRHVLLIVAAVSVTLSAYCLPIIFFLFGSVFFFFLETCGGCKKLYGLPEVVKICHVAAAEYLVQGA